MTRAIATGQNRTPLLVTADHGQGRCDGNAFDRYRGLPVS